MVKKHLGRGLEALIPSLSNDLQEISKPEQLKKSSYEIDIKLLIPPKWQPRKMFDKEKLNQLADSIKSSGIIEPLIISPTDTDKYEIVCGERRYRASIIAGLKTVPVVIKTLDQQQKSFLKLIENLQREDLNPIEEATAYKKLIEEHNLTQEQLAKTVGKERSSIANTLRILNLPQDVLQYIEDGVISSGHARSLASITDTKLVREVAEKIVQDKLTVRDIEEIVKRYKSGGSKTRSVKHILPEIKLLETELQQSLGTKIKIVTTKNDRGKIVIHYHSLDEFDKIIKKLQR